MEQNKTIKLKNLGVNLKGKKAQMELLGVAVIVVFLSLGIFFVVKYNISQPISNTKQVYTQSELSSNTIGAMLTTTVQYCKNNVLADLMIDCASDTTSNDGSKLCKDPRPGATNTTCDEMKNVTSDIFNQTLDKWVKAYVYTVTITDGQTVNQIWNKTKGQCLGEKRSSQYFYSTKTLSTLLIKLDICS